MLFSVRVVMSVDYLDLVPEMIILCGSPGHVAPLHFPTSEAQRDYCTADLHRYTADSDALRR
jgi:hypothetical protein